jgi:hypothetical protein
VRSIPTEVQRIDLSVGPHRPFGKVFWITVGTGAGTLGLPMMAKTGDRSVAQSMFVHLISATRRRRHQEARARAM